jgi:hypothetical protein
MKHLLKSSLALCILAAVCVGCGDVKTLPDQELARSLSKMSYQQGYNHGLQVCIQQITLEQRRQLETNFFLHIDEQTK